MYKIIGSSRTRTFRTLWLLEEMGLEYEHDPAAPRSEPARDANPSGKVPSLVADGQKIPDSLAIMTYLADHQGRFTAPAGTLERARQDSLTFFILEEFDQILWMAARHSFVLPEDQRLPAIKDSLRWEFAQSQDRLMQRDVLNGPFLMGDELRIPDIMLTHCLRWARNAKFEITQPALTDYFERMTQRPAFQRVAAL